MSPWEAARRGGSPAPRPEPLGPGLLPRLAGLSLSSLWGHLPDNTPHFQAYSGEGESQTAGEHQLEASVEERTGVL